MQSVDSPAQIKEKIRQQFDDTPYPNIPIEESIPSSVVYLHKFDSVTPFYLKNQKFLDTSSAVILDAGCGSGFDSLILATANPGARVVGVDISPGSIAMARARAETKGFTNVEFHVMPLEELPTLGISFDYIHCDEVLYLLPDPLAGLLAMRSVLKPTGVLRANLHDAYQRNRYFRGQRLAELLGLMDHSPGDEEIALFSELMRSLKNDTLLKLNTWSHRFESDPKSILANHMLVGDKGFTIPQMFELLEKADLILIEMVDQWDMNQLWQGESPVKSQLEQLPLAQQLHAYDLLNSNHRLLDFWCTCPAPRPAPLSDWSVNQWQNAQIHLHPLLNKEEFKQEIDQCISQAMPLPLPHLRSSINAPVLDVTIAATVLWPLFKGPQPFKHLLDRWQKIHPLSPQTLEPVLLETAQQVLINCLVSLDFLRIILVTVD